MYSTNASNRGGILSRPRTCCLLVGLVVAAGVATAHGEGRAAEQHQRRLNAGEIITPYGAATDVFISQRNANAYSVSFKMTPVGEVEESWKFDVNSNGLDRHTTALRIDGAPVYRLTVGTGPNAEQTEIMLTTPHFTDRFLAADEPATLDAATLTALEDITFYRELVSSVLSEALLASGLVPVIAVDNCASLCAEDNPQPADCDGWWDEYQCCIAEADKDGCRRWCECGGSWTCEGAVAIINTLDHEACVAGLAY